VGKESRSCGLCPPPFSDLGLPSWFPYRYSWTLLDCADLSSSPHVKPAVPKPATMVKSSLVPVPLLHPPLDDDTKDLPSIILVCSSGDSFVVSYDSKSDVQGFVQNLVEDAPACLETTCKAKPGLSVFSLRRGHRCTPFTRPTRSEEIRKSGKRGGSSHECSSGRWTSLRLLDGDASHGECNCFWQHVYL
jgi:hypothetical protein